MSNNPKLWYEGLWDNLCKFKVMFFFLQTIMWQENKRIQQTNDYVFSISQAFF